MVKARTSKPGMEPDGLASAKNPYGGADGGNTDATPARQPTGLLRRVLDPDNLNRAWQRVKSNGGAPGIDGVRIEDFSGWMHQHWPALREALVNGTYRPTPVRRVEIPKPTGGKRPLGIPTVIDRVIQQATLQVIGPMWDPEFSESSFGFRPKRNAHGAVKQIHGYIRQGYRWAVDIDLAKFFDTVEHRKLMGLLARKLEGDPLLVLIGRYLKAGVEEDGDIKPTEEGVPQGGPLSPLLANIMLDELDRDLDRRGHRFARYADDFVVLVKSPKAAQRVMKTTTRLLERRLKLRVNPDKSRVRPASELESLGFVFRRGKVRVSEQALWTFKQRLKWLTGRHWFVSMEDRLAQLRLFVKGWMNYYGLSQIYRDWPGMDDWLRRRIRMCYWVMWKRPRTRIRELKRLGLSIRQAVGLGRSSLGPWKCARLLGFAMSKNWLESQGLVCLADEWWRCAPLR
jgi:RNA-directed DNA polymerase